MMVTTTYHVLIGFISIHPNIHPFFAMMMSTRETRRALEKEGDDDNDNKVVATNKHWPL